MIELNPISDLFSRAKGGPRGARSLEVNISLPIVGYLLAAGAVMILLMLATLHEFRDRNARDTLQLLSGTVIDDSSLAYEQCVKDAPGCPPGAARESAQSRVFDRLVLLSKRLDMGIAVVDKATRKLVFTSGVAGGFSADEVAAVDRYTTLTDASGHDFSVGAVEFAPWNWHIFLAKAPVVYADIASRVRDLLVGTGLVILVVAASLTLYLRQAIARPVGEILAKLDHDEPPAYEGIREFALLSDSIAKMMREVSRHRFNLEELVRARTLELEQARAEIERQKQILEIGRAHV